MFRSAFPTEGEYGAIALDRLRKLMCFLSIKECKPILVVTKQYQLVKLFCILVIIRTLFPFSFSCFDDSDSSKSHSCDSSYEKNLVEVKSMILKLTLSWCKKIFEVDNTLGAQGAFELK